MTLEGIQYSVGYGKKEIDFSLIWKAREKMAIHVMPDSSVVVEAPPGTELDLIKQEVYKKAGWILKQQRRFSRSAPEPPPREYVSGENHRYLGRQYRLKVIRAELGQEQAVKMDRGRILIITKTPKDKGIKEKLLGDWYRHQAKRVFAERLEHWLPHFRRFEIKKPELRIRKNEIPMGQLHTGWKDYS